MPKVEGTKVVEQIRRDFPEAALVVLTTFDTDDDIDRASTFRSRTKPRHHETARVVRTNQYLRTRPPGQPIAVRVRGGQIVTLTASQRRPVTPPPGSSSRSFRCLPQAR